MKYKSEGSLTSTKVSLLHDVRSLQTNALFRNALAMHAVDQIAEAAALLLLHCVSVCEIECQQTPYFLLHPLVDAVSVYTLLHRIIAGPGLAQQCLAGVHYICIGVSSLIFFCGTSVFFFSL